MPGTRKRKYEKIENAEIDLVLRCKDSHEFYERYREAFPDRKKGIDSISKIWKRRAEFQKKRKPTGESGENTVAVSLDTVESLLRDQNMLLSEIIGLLKDQIAVGREIASFQRQGQALAEIGKKGSDAHKDVRQPETKESAKRAIIEKAGNIMVGS
jgi:hypothetical protein